MTDAAIRIRNFDAETDLDGIRACIVELQEHERNIYQRLPPADAVVDECVRYMLEQCDKSDGCILVFEDDVGIGGFVTILNRVISEEPDDGELEYGLISDLVVLQRCRGNTGGRQLMIAAENHARENSVEWLRVGVIAGNRVAEHLYQSLGFSPWHIDLEKQLGDQKKT